MINKYFLTIVLALWSILAVAQVDSKYLEGAVPVVDGKVIFTRTINLNSNTPKSNIFKLVRDWANEEYKFDEKSEFLKRVLLTNPLEDYIVCLGDEYLVFKSNALMVDRARISYQLILTVFDDKCEMTVRNIKYEYEDYDESMVAEKMITDEVALNKDKTKLNRHYDKFRTYTIDLIDALEGKLETYLLKHTASRSAKKETTQPQVVVEPAPAPQVQVAVAASPAVGMANYKEMKAEDLSDNITAIFKDNWALITSAGADSKVAVAAWSGIGNFGGKPMAMTMVDADNIQGDTYIISFFTPIHKAELDKLANGEESGLTPIATPSGAKGYSEAWMMIECKKMMEQPVTEQMSESIQSKEWSGASFNKLYMGEIVNVWAR